MNKKEIINQLNKERSNAALIFKTETVEALNEAIESIEEIDRLKKRAQEAEMLLREVQPFCPVLEKNMISDFFKK